MCVLQSSWTSNGTTVGSITSPVENIYSLNKGLFGALNYNKVRTSSMSSVFRLEVRIRPSSWYTRRAWKIPKNQQTHRTRLSAVMAEKTFFSCVVSIDKYILYVKTFFAYHINITGFRLTTQFLTVESKFVISFKFQIYT